MSWVILFVAGIFEVLWATGLKYRLGVDDSLDVVGVHLVGGLVGTLLIGILATEAAPAGVNGLFYGGGLTQFWSQLIAAVAVMVYSFVLAFIIGKIIDLTMGMRISEDDEIAGVDLTTHAEGAYELADSGSGGKFAGVGQAALKKEEVTV